MAGKQAIANSSAADKRRLVNTFQLVLRSVREAQTLQGALEKERQMRRLLHRLRLAERRVS